MKIRELLKNKHGDRFGNPPITIAFLGDSVTQGCFECYLTSPNSLETVFDYKSAYSTRVRELLNMLYPSAQVNIINSGIVNFYTYAGGTAEKCLADKYHVMSGNIIHKEQVGGMQLSAAFGLGAEFALTQHLGLYFDPSLRYYFDCGQPKSIRTAQPLTFGVEAGLRFKL